MWARGKLLLSLMADFRVGPFIPLDHPCTFQMGQLLITFRVFEVLLLLYLEDVGDSRWARMEWGRGCFLRFRHCWVCGMRSSDRFA